MKLLLITILLTLFIVPQTQHTISGKVVDSKNVPVAGALILLKTTYSTTKKAYTATDGSYNFTAADADYAIIPVASQYWVYDPAYKAVRLNANSVGNDFVATPSNELLPANMKVVSGQITEPDGTPVSGIRVYLETGLESTTDSTGAYKFVTSPGVHTISPSVTKDFLLDPARLRLTISGDTQENNFLAWRMVGTIPLLNLIVFDSDFVRLKVGQTVTINYKLLDENANIYPFVPWQPMETDTTLPSCAKAVANADGTLTLTGTTVGQCKISSGEVSSTGQRVQPHCMLDIIVE